jgi:hypothetical protein
MTQIDKIRDLLQYLPIRDIKIAKEYFNKRDFESLQEIIDSALIKIEKNLEKEIPNKEYLNLNTDALIVLKSHVDSICITLLEENIEIDEFEYGTEYFE